jgi:hypothetical protein
VLAETRPEFKPVPSYATLRRFMSHNGLARRRRVTARRTDGGPSAPKRDVKIGIVSRPQAGLADFYRGMGDLFGVELAPHNRWAGAKVLRDRWQTHIDASFRDPC